MRFRIHGRDRDTGKHVDVPIFAKTREEAIRLGEKQGIEVLSVKVRVRTSSPAIQRFGWIITFGLTLLLLVVAIFVLMVVPPDDEGLPPPEEARRSVEPTRVAISLPSYDVLDQEIKEMEDRTIIKRWIIVPGRHTQSRLTLLLEAEFENIRARQFYRVPELENDVWILVYPSHADFEAGRNCIARLRKGYQVQEPIIEYLPSAANLTQPEK